MRIVCIQPSRDPVVVGASVRIGCAANDDIVLSGPGVVAHHAALTDDARGIVLTVNPAGQRVYINARVVHERALLHAGDTLMLGDNKLLLASNDPPVTVATSLPISATPRPAPAALRIVSGTASGQSLPVQTDLHLGAGTARFSELAFGCCVSWRGDQLIFESDVAKAKINGWLCRRAKLAPGDQIVMGRHHLIVEAPGLQYAAHQAALPVDTDPPSAAPVTRNTSRGPGGWLVLAAGVLAAVIALFLYFHG